jgi:transcriptional regulator with XRE-family HTH domain
VAERFLPARRNAMAAEFLTSDSRRGRRPRLRVARGLSQERLAVDAEIDRTCVSRLECGLENPTVGVLDRLATALSVAVSELLAKRAAGERRP